MRKKIFYLSIFIGLGFVALQIPFTHLIGTNQNFSLFDFFAPTIGAFLNSLWGALAVITIKLIDAMVTNQPLDTVTLIRLFPLALGALYFGLRRYQKLVALIPLACMVLFIMHPQGRQAWFYSLYWLIPGVAAFLPRSLVFRSLGSTFSAHALGSVAFLYAFNLPSAVWIGLIPIVFMERMFFTGGIAVSYLLFNSLAEHFTRYVEIPSFRRMIRPEFTFSKKLLSNL